MFEMVLNTLLLQMKVFEKFFVRFRGVSFSSCIFVRVLYPWNWFQTQKNQKIWNWLNISKPCRSYASIPQNGLTHLNNSWAISRRIVGVCLSIWSIYRFHTIDSLFYTISLNTSRSSSIGLRSRNSSIEVILKKLLIKLMYKFHY